MYDEAEIKMKEIDKKIEELKSKWKYFLSNNHPHYNDAEYILNII
jgi:predicted translin family RNA/ssDNA-binding protein